MKRFSTFNVDLSENIAYNDPAFPAYIASGLMSFYPGLRGNAHWHEDLEFVIPVRNSELYNVDGSIIELKEGDGIFVNSRHVHYGFVTEHTDCEYICIILNPSLLCANREFDESFVRPFVYSSSLPYIKLVREIPWQKKVIGILRELFRLREKPMWQFSVQKQFFEIFELLYVHSGIQPDEQPRESSSLNALKLMMGFIQKNYRKKISLEQIASAGFCCKSKCSALFNAYLKESPVTYLIKYRLKVSTELLCKTEMPVTEIAYESGFSGTSYFCETFHKYYQTAPLEFRKNSALLP
ncbi:MAG: AraC family transcriptional regulator [Treponema sp.]|nr:AraC family transcriptional regulator [Treponema sp.]